MSPSPKPAELQFLLLLVVAGHEDLAGGGMNSSGEELAGGDELRTLLHLFVLDQNSENIC